MNLGKACQLNTGIIGYRRRTPNLGTPRSLPLFETQVILVNIKISKRGLSRCGIYWTFYPGSTSGMDPEVTIASAAFKSPAIQITSFRDKILPPILKCFFSLTTRQFSKTNWVPYTLGFVLFVQLHPAACGILVPTGIIPMPLALGARSLNHQTTKQVPSFLHLFFVLVDTL